ncbi:agamous-like MADS-box protein AGL80 [Nicotiana tomentosiformis]|uniref:agamous-like MADS-box protein AGL80 n=1 Tax=Nicotiana tomentosiformis TaxID=4098 RepID=UPI00388C87AA
MTRSKVNLAFITNESARKATLKKRKKGLMKKVSELSTLCGIDACAIIYSPYDQDQPEVWPSIMGAQRVLEEFKRMPEMEQCKKMMNQESFIRQRIVKASEQLKKKQKENRKQEVIEVMYQCLTGKGLDNLILTDLNDLGWLIDQNLKEICKRIEDLKKGASASNSQLGVHAMESPQKRPFTDWMNNPSDYQQIGLVNNGDEMNVMQFNDNQNTMWSTGFFL